MCSFDFDLFKHLCVKESQKNHACGFQFMPTRTVNNACHCCQGSSCSSSGGGGGKEKKS